MKFSIGLSALIVTLALWPKAASAGLCEEILADELKSGSKKVADSIFDIFRSDSSTVEVEKSGLESVSDIYVTITEGTANTLDCDRDVVSSLYFPLGLVVRPLRDIDHQGRSYTLFQTEYGMQLLIEQRAVAPVTDKDLYVFSDSADTHPVCVTASKNDCSAMAIAKEPVSENWPFIHARWSYLHLPYTAETGAIVAATREGLAATLDVQDGDIPFDTIEDVPFDAIETAVGPDDTCPSLTGMLYHRGVPPKLHGGESKYPFGKFEISTCVANPDDALHDTDSSSPPALRRLKFVTADAYKQHFARLWSATVFKSLGSVSTLLEQALNLTQPFSTRKECTVEATSKNSLTLGASAELQLWDVGAVFSDELLVELKKAFATEKQYVVRSYLHQGSMDGQAASTRWPPFFDIQLIAQCKGDRAVQPEKIEIDSPLAWKKIELFIDVLDEHYDLVAGGPLGRPTESVKRTRLDSGYIFVIKEFNHYYYWRDVLRAELALNSVLNDIVPSVAVDRYVLIDYFAHLVMSAAMQSTVATKRDKTS